MHTLLQYATAVVQKASKSFKSAEIFAKVLTQNDDSGRHGVLIPTDAYSFFPFLTIPDSTQNVTDTFSAFNCLSASWTDLAYKYYERYPERRLTRLSTILNDASGGARLLVVFRIKHTDGSFAYYFDCANSATGGRFSELFRLIFGDELVPVTGRFIVRPVDAETFSSDDALTELLAKFDEVRERGWIDTMREGNTGIGYTFETLVGIKENNDQKADFKGIEIKCKGVKEVINTGSGKINLFQAGPTWISKSTSKERIRLFGKLGLDGLYTCNSQVTALANNRELRLDVSDANQKIDLLKKNDPLGYWSFGRLEKRLLEKHARAAFVKAKIRQTKVKTQYSYEEFVYCDQPSIQRFVDLVSRRNIVFEFLMSEKPNGSIRNRGYPWRLIRAEYLDQLFAFQIKLR